MTRIAMAGKFAIETRKIVYMSGVIRWLPEKESPI